MKKLLFVDDNLDTFDLISEIAKIYDFSVDILTSGEDTLAHLDATPDDYFFLITDLNLGIGILGTTLIQKAKEIKSDLRCALYTAYPPEYLKEEDIEIIPKQDTDILELGKMIKQVEQEITDELENKLIDEEK